MKFLLDTHVFLWAVSAPERLQQDAVNELSRNDNEFFLSPISAWEIHLLSERGRISLPLRPAQWIAKTLKALPFREVPITMAIASASRRVSLPHRDPADRFLAATALIHDLILVTRDARLLGCREIRTMAA